MSAKINERYTRLKIFSLYCFHSNWMSNKIRKMISFCFMNEHLNFFFCNWGCIRWPPPLIRWWIAALAGGIMVLFKCQCMYQHPCGEFLCLSLQVNNVLSALKKNRCMWGMAVFWIPDTPIPAAEMSLDDSGRFPCVKIAHHPTLGEWRMQRK